MAGINRSPRAFVEKLGNENQEFYGSPDGRGLLAVIELTFDNRWVYLYELVQNALDVGASSIGIRVAEAGDALIFQHNGDRSLDERDVKALSKVFRSTKGARSVGFMGIGFKSVFTRFQEARISGWGWTFRYEITQDVGKEFGDVQRDLLGAVVPIWDDEIAAPEDGFTTRFEMRRRTDEGTDLKSDLVRFLPDDDRAPLAILAMSGLERLEIDGQIWELRVSGEPDGSFESAALSEHENRLWRVFPALLHGPEQIADLPVPVAESPGAVRIGHPERSHLVEYLAPNSVFNSLPRQRSSPHLRPDDRLVTIDRVLHHASLGVA